MPSRPTLSARLKPTAEPQGAEAYFGQGSARGARAEPRSRKPETVSPATEPTPALDVLIAQPGRRRGPKWDEANQRASFYLPVVLLSQLDAVAGPAVSKSQIVTAALQQYLRTAGQRRP